MMAKRPPPHNGAIGLLQQPVQMSYRGNVQVPKNAVVRAHMPFAGPAIWVIADRYNHRWEIRAEEWCTLTRAPKKPEDAFQNLDTFLCGLATDREATLRELMQRVCDTWLNDGRDELVRCLTCWAMDGINLSDVEDLIQIASGHVDDQWS